MKTDLWSQWIGRAIAWAERQRLQVRRTSVSLLPVLGVLAMATACSPQARGSAGPASQPSAAAEKAAPSSDSTEKPLEWVSLKIGVIGSTTDAPAYVAEERGYFKDEKLNVELLPFQSAARMVAPLATGELEVGGGAPSAGLYNAIARGVPLRIVASKALAVPGQTPNGLVVRKDLVDSGVYRSPRDLKGMKIAIAATGTTIEIELERALQKGGLTLGDAEVLEMTFPDMTVALTNQGIDAAMHTEPFISRGVDSGLLTYVFPADELYPQQQIAVWLYSPKFAAEQPDAARRLMTALVRGMRDYYDAMVKGRGREQMAELMARATTIKEPALHLRMAPVGTNPDGYVNRASLVDDADWFYAKGYIKDKPNMDAVIDNSYADYAVRRLGKYER